VATPDAVPRPENRQIRGMKSLIVSPALLLVLVSTASAEAPLRLASTAPPAAASDGAELAPAPDSAAYSAVHGQELMLNAFRAPSIGLEYRFGALSVHGGVYPTVIDDSPGNDTSWFAKAGVGVWFLPIAMLGNERSSFYASLSYLREIGDDGWENAGQLEAGFRLVVWQGLFVRLGASALYAPGRDCPTDECSTVKFRPNPAVGWAIALD
jgi:hypothetical protein